MREFFYFMRQLLYMLHFVRGVLIALVATVFLCAMMLMLAEGLPFGESLYATAITALTIGYGDITPKTAAGRVISVAIGFFGVLFTGLMVAVATRALASAVEHERDAFAHKQRRETAP